VEISRKRAYKTSVRLTKRNIKNFALLDSDGELALKLLLPENSINEIHINFPDPWLRKRQWKKRIFKPSFLIQIIRVLKREGTLNLVTDVGEYATEAALLLSGFPQLKNNYDKLIVSNLYRSFPTLFYRKMSPLRDINYLSFKKAL
jgi:tRNA (guanine-N7-)-methyltransferase